MASFRIPVPASALLAAATLALHACSDSPAGPRTPASIHVVGSAAQQETVGATVEISFMVRDAAGRPIAGQTVRFEPRGGGSLSRMSALTGADGVASAGGWILGTTAGTNELRAVVASDIETIVSVQTVPAAPAELVLLAQNVRRALAGSRLEPAPGVRLQDRFGNGVPNESVEFAAAAGSGVLTDTQVMTGADGSARPGSWRLGAAAGLQSIAARAGEFAVAIEVEAAAGEATRLLILSGANQVARVGTAVQVSPSVQVTDDLGNPVAGASVEFAAREGGGTLEGAMQISDERGRATLGVWILGTRAGLQSVSASIAAASLVIEAEALPDAPVTLEKISGDEQTARPGALVTPTPAVKVSDRYGNGVPNVAVRFEVTAGGGGIGRQEVLSSPDGTATPEAWALGSAAGDNALAVTAAGLTVSFRATAAGEPVIAERIVKFAGDGTSCPLSTSECRFAVRVTDLLGRPLAGRDVDWTTPEGSNVATTSDERGFVTSTNLTVSAVAGEYRQSARLGSTGEELTFTYRLVPAGGFDVDLRFVGTVTSSQTETFEAAARAWERVITGDLAAVSLNVAANECGIDHPPLNETVDDVVVYVLVQEMDGVGGILGAAGPCLVRADDGLPALGVVLLDRADVEEIEQKGLLFDLAAHEIGHVLGIGTLWKPRDLVSGAGTSDPVFVGTATRPRFQLAGGSTPFGVPLENTGSAGTREVHWRESVLTRELMTGFLEPTGNPLSAITVASLADLGYQVNYGAAVDFTLQPSAAHAQWQHAIGERIYMQELSLPPPRRVRVR
jgi:hypothetical protein